MTNNEIIKVLEEADCAFDTWRHERGLQERDGEWGGVGLALAAVNDYLCEERKKEECKAKWEARLANPGTITGYVLEFQNEDDEWCPAEFSEECPWESEFPEWDLELDCGLFAELGDNCLCGHYDDWEIRCGVAWDKRYNPIDDPRESGIWGGVTNDNAWAPGELWRVRKVTISAELSEKAKSWIKLHVW